jgi:hypothetical protein
MYRPGTSPRGLSASHPGTGPATQTPLGM